MSSDITKCEGDGCPIKDGCYRYVTPANPHRQAFFSETPGYTDGGEFICDMFWGVAQERIYNQLKDIFNGDTTNRS